jgi:energy coupling factor transporter S component ThiW
MRENAPSARADHLRRLVLAAMFAAMATVLGSFSIPVGYTKVAPLQHAVNAIAGVFLGPWYAAAAALVTATLRYNLHVGTIFAFPGSPFGALVVGGAYRVLRNDAAALLEPIGTGVIGATVAWWLFQPLVPASHHTLVWFMVAFLSSSIPGAIIGYVVLLMLRRVPAVRAGAVQG